MGLGVVWLQELRTPNIPSFPGDDSWDLITCYCRKPFAGRPMIECSLCGTWIHLSCAKIKKEKEMIIHSNYTYENTRTH